MLFFSGFMASDAGREGEADRNPKQAAQSTDQGEGDEAGSGDAEHATSVQQGRFDHAELTWHRRTDRCSPEVRQRELTGRNQ
jgi:hypothetical protein